MPVLCYVLRQSKTLLEAPKQMYATRASSVDITLGHWLVSSQCSITPSGRKWANKAVPSLRAHVSASDAVRRIKGREQSPRGLSLMPQKTKDKDFLPESGVSIYSATVISAHPLPCTSLKSTVLCKILQYKLRACGKNGMRAQNSRTLPVTYEK